MEPYTPFPVSRRHSVCEACEQALSPAEASPASHRSTARWMLASYLATFITARLIVLLIMARKLPELYLRVKGTHVHHLSWGILLLSLVGAFTLLTRPTGRRAVIAAMAYGIGLALTFDEFGMWLHLGGAYWQRASYDAVAIVAGVLALIGFAPSPRRMRQRPIPTALALLCAAGLLVAVLSGATAHVGRMVLPAIEALASTGR